MLSIPTLRTCAAAAALLLASSSAVAQPLPRGQVVERLTARSDTAQHYALYLPSTYDEGRR